MYLPFLDEGNASMNLRALVFLAVLVATCLTATGPTRSQVVPQAAPPPKLRLLVPAYFYPSGAGLKQWDTLIKSSPTVPITVIANPASGPGTTADRNYTEVIDRAQKAGITVIGYVTTSYGKRTVDAILAEVATWKRLYPTLQGIFLDEQPSGAEKIEMFAALYAAIHSRIKDAVVIGNPGTMFSDVYLTRPGVDIACIFENRAGFEAVRGIAGAKRTQLAALPYLVKEETRMREMVAKAVERGIGLLYITDAGVANDPWTRLPTYWDAEVSAIRDVNTKR
jgi:hypothetical protein